MLRTSAPRFQSAPPPAGGTGVQITSTDGQSTFQSATPARRSDLAHPGELPRDHGSRRRDGPARRRNGPADRRLGSTVRRLGPADRQPPGRHERPAGTDRSPVAGVTGSSVRPGPIAPGRRKSLTRPRRPNRGCRARYADLKVSGPRPAEALAVGGDAKLRPLRFDFSTIGPPVGKTRADSRLVPAGKRRPPVSPPSAGGKPPWINRRTTLEPLPPNMSRRSPILTVEMERGKRRTRHGGER